MKLAAIAFAALIAMLLGAPLVSKPAEAAPAIAGASMPVADSQALMPGVEEAQYYRRRGYYRPRYVCRIRYGYYGPRRVCFRRY